MIALSSRVAVFVRREKERKREREREREGGRGETKGERKGSREEMIERGRRVKRVGRNYSMQLSHRPILVHIAETTLHTICLLYYYVQY